MFAGIALNLVGQQTSALAIYAVISFRPRFVLDLVRGLYFTNSALSTFADAITHTRASTATYVDSTGTLQVAAINEPRIGHHVWNGSTWVNEGLLHESEARTNLFTQSGNLSVSPWTLIETTIATDTGPFVGSTAYAVTENDTPDGTIHALQQVYSFTSGTTYTVSVWAKSSNRRMQITGANTATFPANATFDLQAGTVATVSLGKATIQDFGNGWYRCSVTAVAAVTTVTNVRFALSLSDNDTFYDGDGASKVTFYGPQMEAGPTPSSYIPTSGSTVTRAADVLTIPAANLPWNPLAVSIQMDGRVTYADEGVAAQQTFLRWQLDANNYVSVDLDTDGAATGEVNFNQAASGVVDTVATAGTALAPSIATAFNTASRHGSTFINGAVNGTALTADTTPVALPDLSATDLNLGLDYNGTIRTFRIWGQDIGDAGIEEASS